jgi:hypothetical protein
MLSVVFIALCIEQTTEDTETIEEQPNAEEQLDETEVGTARHQFDWT